MDSWDEFDRRAEELGHKLRRDEEGEIDHFVCDVGFHNGPGCELCHDDWCHHCTAPSQIKPCDGGVEYRASLEKREREELARLKAKYEAASGIETGTAKSEALSAEHESPTPKGDAHV